MAKKKPHDDDPTFRLERFLHPSVQEVFRDESLWVLDKPAGILSHPNTPARAPNALFRAPYDMREEVYELRDRPGGETRRVWLVHRLDQDTSGLIVCTFDPEAGAILKEALFEHEVFKEYLALLVGFPERAHGEWEDHLVKSGGRGRVDVRVKHGAAPNTRTRFRVQRYYEPARCALVALSPETGRTHQLRVQAAARKTPIAGDDRYGDFTANRFLLRETGLRRMFLHASRLEFRHPRGGHRLRFHRELGRQLAEPLSKLEELTSPVPRRS